LWSGRETSEKIVGYYSYLFTYPSRPMMVAGIAAISSSAGALALYMGGGSPLTGLAYGLLGLALPMVASDVLVQLLFGGDELLTPRRFTIISYTSCIAYSGVLLASSVAGLLLRDLSVLFGGIAFSAALNVALRSLAISAFSERPAAVNLASIFAQPSLVLGASSLLLDPLDGPLILRGFVAMAVAYMGVRLMFVVLEGWRGEEGVRLLPLFRAFVYAWAEEVNGPLEEEITRMGVPADLDVDTIVFRDGGGSCRGALVAPYIHPGPFRNVGSSGLTRVLAEGLGGELGCDVLVAHGVSNHEQDMTSSGEMGRVLEAVLGGGVGAEGVGSCSPMVRAEVAGAKASCQLFGGTALLTLTLSPKSHDDLPNALRERIEAEARGMGLTAVVVDAHNSLLQGDELDDEDVESLFEAAMEAVRGAMRLPQVAFHVGADRVIPEDWTLDDGMGPCGIACVTVMLEEGARYGYLVADSNNMASGLRERIISALMGSGLEDVEVLTSDTHLVNAIGATTRGYYPLGERTDEGRLLEYVKRVVEGAAAREERCTASHFRARVGGLTVLGVRGLRLLGSVLEQGFGLFKRTALMVIPASVLVAGAVVFLL